MSNPLSASCLPWAAPSTNPATPLVAYRLDCSVVLLSARQPSERGGTLTRSVLESQPENDGCGSQVHAVGQNAPNMGVSGADCHGWPHKSAGSFLASDSCSQTTVRLPCGHAPPQQNQAHLLC